MAPLQTKALRLNALLLEGINKQGGFVNAHSHLDRAYSLTKSSFHFTNSTLQQKWNLIDTLKQKSNVSQIYDRMATGLEEMLKQKVQAIGSFIDVDCVIKDKAILAADRIKKNYGKKLKIKFINQVLKGVIDKESKYWFDYGAEFVDIIGGLPGKDKGKESEHLDIILSTARGLKKMVHVHIDQLNSQLETETQLLAKKTIEHKMEGSVVGIHGISIAAHPKKYRMNLYKLMKKAKLMMISCPSAWIDSRRSEVVSVTHNAVTPIDELVPAGMITALGTDNISDIYKPFSSGDLFTELKILLESCHFYDINSLVDIATVNGLKTLGIK